MEIAARDVVLLALQLLGNIDADEVEVQDMVYG
jgi:hypothetical protein